MWLFWQSLTVSQYIHVDICGKRISVNSELKALTISSQSKAEQNVACRKLNYQFPNVFPFIIASFLIHATSYVFFFCPCSKINCHKGFMFTNWVLLLNSSFAKAEFWLLICPPYVCDDSGHKKMCRLWMKQLKRWRANVWS